MVNRHIDPVITEFVGQGIYTAILHIGGEYGSEAPVYKQCADRFTYVEPHPVYAQYLADQGYNVLQVAVGVGDGTFYLAGNASSLLEPLEHLVSGTEQVEVVPLSAIEEGYDCIVIDAQGSSYDILASGTLRRVYTVVCEASVTPRYDGERTMADILELMLRKEFVLDAIYRHGPYDIYDLGFRKSAY
jgi:hypothetical protein